MFLIQIKHAQIKFNLFGFWTVYSVHHRPHSKALTSKLFTYTLYTCIQYTFHT
jgi:hypothetical protein